MSTPEETLYFQSELRRAEARIVAVRLEAAQRELALRTEQFQRATEYERRIDLQKFEIRFLKDELFKAPSKEKAKRKLASEREEWARERQAWEVERAELVRGQGSASSARDDAGHARERASWAKERSGWEHERAEWARERETLKRQANRSPNETRAEGPGFFDGKMTTAVGLEILGLKPGVPPAEIRAAYGRLIKKVHPDTGGSAFFAKQLNAARDYLLR